MGALNLKSDFGPVDELVPVLKEMTGVVVPPHKSYLFQQRLGPVMVKYRLDSFAVLAKRVRGDLTVRREFIHAMTTHETSFFRDMHPFETLRNKILPDLLGELAKERRGPNAFTVWSAAASSGKEVYTVAMMFDELLDENPQRGLDVNRLRLLGTDISEPVLDEARKAAYGQGEGLRGLPTKYRERYFEQKDGTYHVAPQLKRRCSFRQLDLTKRFTLGPFNLVLARNVLIYFDSDTKTKVLERIHGALAPGGVLLLGSSEGLEPGAAPLFDTHLLGRTRYYTKSKAGR